MDISAKSRKILWGRSGNRCAICRRELVIDATKVDSEAVVGEECHIVSGKAGGPRCDLSFRIDELYDYLNLILLCRVHHKMVDGQVETYTVTELRQIKSNHEGWVSSRLRDGQRTQQGKIKGNAQNAPAFLNRISSGSEILDLVDDACVFDTKYEEPKSKEEAGVLAKFCQMIEDWGDLDLSVEDRIHMGFDITDQLDELEGFGYLVFGGKEVQILEGADEGKSDWPVAIIRVVRTNNQALVNIEQSTVETRKNGSSKP